jgi:ribosomal protein S18 acetylase RimI-like enzyme
MLDAWNLVLLRNKSKLVFSIRNASTQDIPLIRDLTFRIWPQTYASILSQQQIDYMLELMYSESSLQKQMDEGSQFIFVYDDGVPVGFASVQETQPSIFKLHKIYILPSQQGKGTGRFVIDYILNEIKQKGASALQLQVNRFNKARNFYEKLGFTVIDEKDFDIGNGYFMNDFVMEKVL